MRRPLMLVAGLLLALMTSAGGYVLATAFCAEAGKAEPACHQMGQTSQRSRQEHVATEHESHGANVNAASFAGEEPFETCSHCVSHSNLPQSAFDLRQAETSRSSGHVDAPEAVATVSYNVLIPRAVNARDHAPPGDSARLHVRLNVFRI